MNHILKKTTLGALAASCLLMGCSPESNYGAFNPDPEMLKVDTFEYSREQEVPKLDLVFIMDNSKSMHAHLTNLSTNIEKFTEKFNTDSIDLRVGVVSVFDTTRYKEYSAEDAPERLEDKTNYEQISSEVQKLYLATSAGEPAAEYNLGLEMYMLSHASLYPSDYRYAYFEDQGRSNIVLPLGMARPVRVSDGLMDLNRSYMVGSDPRFIDELKQSLLLTSDFVKLTSGGWAQYGAPVVEEVFSVVRSIVDPETNAVLNRGFLREDAHLAIVIVTDAEDSTKAGEALLDPDIAAAELRAFKNGGAKLSVYGVLSILTEEVPSCDTDAFVRDEKGDFQPLRPKRIESFVRKLQGSTYSLCSPDFGKELASIGSDLVRKVYEQNDFELTHIPTSIEDVKVYVDDQINDTWFYNNNRHSISLNAIAQSRATVRVEYSTPNPAMLDGNFVEIE